MDDKLDNEFPCYLLTINKKLASVIFWYSRGIAIQSRIQYERFNHIHTFLMGHQTILIDFTEIETLWEVSTTTMLQTDSATSKKAKVVEFRWLWF